MADTNIEVLLISRENRAFMAFEMVTNPDVKMLWHCLIFAFTVVASM